MPKVPVYELQVRGGGSGISSPDFLNLSTPYANTVSGVGALLQHRSERMLDEYDQTVALDAANSYREEARGVLTELTKKEGLDAQGVQNEYNEWSKKKREEIVAGGLQVKRQERYFDTVVGRRAEADLDKLANHEFVQINKAKNEKFDGYTAEILRDTRVHADNDVRVTEMIGEFEAELDAKYPGIDHTAKKIKFRQMVRQGQVEELIQTNPALAKIKLEEYKADLQHAYVPLKKAIEQENKESRITGIYNSLQSQFGDEGSIAKLSDGAWMQKNFPEVTREEADRVMQSFKAKVMWKKQMKDLQEEEVHDNLFKGVQAAMRTGNIIEAERLLYNTPGLDPNKAATVQNYIYTAASRFDDPSVIDKVRKGIQDGTIRLKSEVEMYKGRGMSERTNGLMLQELADHYNNPEREKYIKDAEDYFDRMFKTRSAKMMDAKPAIMSDLRARVMKDNLKGEQILKLMMDTVGTYEQLESATKVFGMAMPKWFGEESSSNPNAARYLKDVHARLKGEPLPSSPGAQAADAAVDLVTPEKSLSKNVDSLPQVVKSEVIRQLTAAGKPVDNETIWKVYQQNKSRLDKLMPQLHGGS